MSRANSFLPFLALSLILSLLSGCCNIQNCIILKKPMAIKKDVFYVDGREDIGIAYRDSGKQDALLTILFVHGLGASMYFWNDLAPLIEQDYRVILIDLLGHGDSSKPKNHSYSISEQGNILRQFIVEKNLKDLVIVGISYGGATTLEAVLPLFKSHKQNPVSALVLLAPSAFYFEPPGICTLLKWAFYPHIWLPLMLDYVPLLNRILPGRLVVCSAVNEALKMMFKDDKRIRPELNSELVRIYKQRDARKALKVAASNIPKELKARRNLRERYSPIECPVLLIWGEFDNFVPHTVLLKLCETLPQAQWALIDNCGHAIEAECPGDIAAKLTRFIEEIKRKKSDKQKELAFDEIKANPCAGYCKDNSSDD